MATELKGRKVRELIGPVTIKNRIRKNQKKAFWVGAFYWLATLILFVLSIFPMVGEYTGYGSDEHVWVVTFMEPLMAFINGLSNLKGMSVDVFNNGLVSIFYAVLLVFSFCCLFGSTVHLFKIRKKNPTTKWGYNRSTAAMKSMGRLYGFQLFCIVANSVTAVFFGDGNFTLFFYITLAIGIFFHIVLNLAGSTISYFQTSEDRFKPIEQKRKLGYLMYFLRNVLQMGLVAALVILLDRFGGVLDGFYYLVSGKQPTNGMTIIILLVLILLWLCVCGLIKYVFSMVNYNEYGLKLRRPFPAFLFIRRWVFWFSYKDVNALALVLTGNAIFAAVGQILVMSAGVKPQWALLAICAILLQWIFADVMFKVLERNKIRKEKKKRLDNLDPKADRDDFDQFIDEEFKLIQEKIFYKTSALPPAPESDVVSVGDTSEPVKKTKKQRKAEKLAAKEARKAEREEAKERIDSLFEEEPTIAPEEPVSTEESIVKEELTDEERARRSELMNKWMEMAEKKVDLDEDGAGVTFLEEQIVKCPGCEKKLSVKFGTDVAKCPACSTMFVLKKLAKEEPVVDGEEAETPKEENVIDEELYAREAEEEVRKMIDEA